MSYLYLDESGNLGYQLQTAGVSRHFVITILEVPDDSSKKAIKKAIERTMKNKVRGKSRLQRNLITELKGAKTSCAIKNYFYSQVASVPFSIYAVILDKKRFVSHLQVSKTRVYNFFAHLAIKEFPLEQATARVTLVLDRSKSKPGIRIFNQYLLNQVEARLPPRFLWISSMMIRRITNQYKRLIFSHGESTGNMKRKIRGGMKYFAARSFMSRYTPNKKESDPYTALPQGYGQPMEGNTLRTV
ncbi:MAG: DUF3800 domain-containing protein [candidate division KSB1 bacterium]|nr:DUF3800 domain-containing protein [candidate division KSB1 bacterium]MDZ7300730.1 DUF3800 domain-containing protein [candidate division KSB1 bacterium]MDZ7310000.1 DUF3800 domain-containing protein [candidate division KSB1 bacterium]